MITAAYLFLLAGFSNEPGLEGPTNPAGTVHAYDVVDGVGHRVASSQLLTSDHVVQWFNNGNPVELRGFAHEQCQGRQGWPLIVEFTVKNTGTDGTVIRHTAAGAAAAEMIRAQLADFLDPLPGTWPVTLEADPAPATDCAAVRIAIGDLSGTNGRNWLGGEAFHASIANAISVAVLNYVLQPIPE